MEFIPTDLENLTKRLNDELVQKEAGSPDTKERKEQIKQLEEHTGKLAEYRKKVAERLTSDIGIKLKGNRCIEPEAVFRQMKYDMGYKRFRHFGLDKVKMDFAFHCL